MARSAAEVLKFNSVRNRLPLRQKRSETKAFERSKTDPPPQKEAWKEDWEKSALDPAREWRERLMEYVQYFFIAALFIFIFYCLAHASKGKVANRTPGWGQQQHSQRLHRGGGGGHGPARAGAQP